MDIQSEASPIPESTTAAAEDTLATAAAKGDKIDQLLSKYITVWIWSVLFGASTGLVVSLITYRTDARWGPLNAVLLFFLAISVAAAVVSWRALLKYLSVYLIPKFLTVQTFPNEDEKKMHIEAAYALRRAFQYLIIASVARVVITLLEMAYASLMGPGF
jgi:hypothetical protein